MSSIYEPFNSIPQIYHFDFPLFPELWGKFNKKGLNGLETIDFENWHREKLFSKTNCFSSKINQIPTDCGGIYVYVLESDIVPGIGKYIMYIGKASKTDNQNLRRRVQSYKQCITYDDRPKIHNLFKYWSKYLYVYYLPVYDSNENIDLLESRLIGCVIPPCNSEIRDAVVSKKVKAFR